MIHRIVAVFRERNQPRYRDNKEDRQDVGQILLFPSLTIPLSSSIMIHRIVAAFRKRNQPRYRDNKEDEEDGLDVGTLERLYAHSKDRLEG